MLERHAAPYPLPRGVHLDDEVHRVLQRLGVADEFARLSRPAPGMRLLDASHRVLAEFRRSPGAGRHGWPQANLFDQPDLEALLRRRLDALPAAQVRTGADVVEVRPGAAPTVTYLRDGVRVQLHAAAVLACDGATSPVREALRLGWRVLGPAQPWAVVDVRCRARLGVWDGVQQVCSPVRAATVLRVGADRYRWEFRLRPGETAAGLTAGDGLLRLLRPWTGEVPAGEIEVLRVAEYEFRAGIARRWRDGRVLLLGDAAHLTPPFTGQGLGAGLRDADNLAWKLARVLQDGAPDALLDTYEQERAPHVRGMVRLAVLVGRLMTGGGPQAAHVRRLVLAALPRLPGLRARVLDSTTPRLRGGALAPRRAPRPVGQLVPQPPVRVGGAEVRLDDVLGPRPAVLTRVEPDRALLDLAARTGARVLVCGPHVHDGGLDAYLRQAGATAVVVRPDHAVLAVARTRTPGVELSRGRWLALLGASTTS